MKVHHYQAHGESLSVVELTCSTCGDTFKRGEYDVVGADDYYCSYECRRNEGEYECPYDGCEYTSDSELGIQQHHKRSHGVSLTKVEVECEYCGQVFERQRSKVRQYDGTFCSKTCRAHSVGERLSEVRVGEKNPMYGRTGKQHPRWSGEYDQAYGEGWLTARRKTLRRDQFRCQLCGMTDGEHHDVYDRQLDVHHMDPVRTFVDKSDAHTLDNLITLCRRCHVDAETNDDYQIERSVA